MFVLVRTRLHSHVDAHNQGSVSSGKKAMRYIYDIKFGMLKARENEIALRKCSAGTAHLRTFEGTLTGM